MKIMTCRAEHLQIALENLTQGNLPYQYIGNVATGDDLGIYYFIPLLAHLLHISAAQATGLFWSIIVISSVVIGLVSIFLFFKNWFIRIIALYLFYHLANLIYQLGDVYIAPAAIIMAFVPLSLYIINKQQKFWIKTLVLFLCGITLGIFHYLRNFSEIPVLFFILFILFFNKDIVIKSKSYLVGMLAIGIMLPCLYFTALIHKSEPYNNQALSSSHQHPLWHNVYLGLGYLPNPYGITWNDQIAIDKARSINKDVIAYSPLYESILRTQVIHIAKTNPLFIVRTAFAKAHDLSKQIRKYLFVALLFAIFFPKSWRIEVAFWGLLLLSAIPGLIATPQIFYVLGLIAAAVIYMIVSIGHAFDVLVTPSTTTQYRYSNALNFLLLKTRSFISKNNKISSQTRLAIIWLSTFLNRLISKQQNSHGEVQ